LANEDRYESSADNQNQGGDSEEPRSSRGRVHTQELKTGVRSSQHSFDNPTNRPEDRVKNSQRLTFLLTAQSRAVLFRTHLSTGPGDHRYRHGPKDCIGQFELSPILFPQGLLSVGLPSRCKESSWGSSDKLPRKEEKLPSDKP